MKLLEDLVKSKNIKYVPAINFKNYHGKNVTKNYAPPTHLDELIDISNKKIQRFGHERELRRRAP